MFPRIVDNLMKFRPEGVCTRLKPVVAVNELLGAETFGAFYFRSLNGFIPVLMLLSARIKRFRYLTRSSVEKARRAFGNEKRKFKSMCNVLRLTTHDLEGFKQNFLSGITEDQVSYIHSKG